MIWSNHTQSWKEKEQREKRMTLGEKRKVESKAETHAQKQKQSEYLLVKYDIIKKSEKKNP